MAKSAEYKAFKSLYAYLRDGLEPGTLAALAFSRDLLTRSERDAATNQMHTDVDRMEKLLNAVEKRILAEPRQFYAFVETVEEESTFDEVATKLRAACVPTPTADKEEGDTGPWSGQTLTAVDQQPHSTVGMRASGTSQTTDRLLGDSDFFEITDYLLPLADDTDVHKLGHVLGIYPDRLKAIQRNSHSFLDDVVSAWLRREGDVDKRGGPRWSTLVKALRNPRLRQTGLANVIARDKGLPCT